MTHLGQFSQKKDICITKKNDYIMVNTLTKQVLYNNDDRDYNSGPFYYIFVNSFWKPPVLPRRKPCKTNTCPPFLPKKGGKVASASTFAQPKDEAITVGADVASVGKATQSEVQAKCEKSYASKTTVLQWGKEFSMFYDSKRAASKKAKKGIFYVE